LDEKSKNSRKANVVRTAIFITTTFTALYDCLTCVTDYNLLRPGLTL